MCYNIGANGVTLLAPLPFRNFLLFYNYFDWSSSGLPHRPSLQLKTLQKFIYAFAFKLFSVVVIVLQ